MQLGNWLNEFNGCYKFSGTIDRKEYIRKLFIVLAVYIFPYVLLGGIYVALVDSGQYTLEEIQLGLLFNALVTVPLVCVVPMVSIVLRRLRMLKRSKGAYFTLVLLLLPIVNLIILFYFAGKFPLDEN